MTEPRVKNPIQKKKKIHENRCRVMVWIELTLSHAACALLGFVLYYNIGINITYPHITSKSYPKKKNKTLVHILYFVVTDNKNIIFNDLTGKITMEWHHIINNEFWSTLTHSMNIIISAEINRQFFTKTVLLINKNKINQTFCIRRDKQEVNYLKNPCWQDL